MLVHEVMTSPVLSVLPNENYQSALRLMQQKNVHHLPVIDDHGTLCGIVAERDLLLAAGSYMNTIAEVELVMRRDVITVPPSCPVDEAAHLIVQHHIGSLPVADADGRIVGIITERDLFVALLNMLHTTSVTLREREAGMR